ncbi:MAG: hypothetical protein ACRD2C_24450 [Acidimicrobiales bacterium]
MIGPHPGLAPATARQQQRATRRERRSQRIDRLVGAAAVTRPITEDGVRSIASEGYPLWESIETMQLRNRRITLAYSDLAARLAALIAHDGGRRDVNWCSFACWSSQTVGTWIEKDAVPEPLRDDTTLPPLVRRGLIALARWLTQRGNGASYRCLAAGNRFVFLEMGSAISIFLEEFDAVDRSGPDESHWDRYWQRVERLVARLARLDPSWLPTEAPPPGDLQLGLRQYYLALFTTDPDERAERVLAGNILAVSYEQRRLAGYVSASLALFTNRALRNLVQHRSGAVTGWHRHWPSTIYSRMMTRGLVLNTADEQLQVGRPLPAPPTPPGCPLFPLDLEEITLPILQALLTRYDRSRGEARRRRARDWTSYDDRMSYITNLFRSRQHRQSLFDSPFLPEVEQALLSGRLAPETTTVPSDDEPVPVVVTGL